MFNFGDPANRVLIHQGESKSIYLGPEPGTLIVSFSNEDSDAWRMRISEYLWNYLSKLGIKNHFIKTINIREYLAKSVDVSPVFAKVYSLSDESLKERFGIEVGTEFIVPLVEWHLNSPALGNPPLCRDHIHFFGWADEQRLNRFKELAIRINEAMRSLFVIRFPNVRLGQIELSFGLDRNGKNDGCNYGNNDSSFPWKSPNEADYIFLAGELSPESIILWDHAEQLTRSKRYEVMKGIWTN